MNKPLQIITVLILCVSVMAINRVVEAQQINSSKFDEFSGSNWEDAMTRLDNFALELTNNPHMTGVLIVYGGQQSRRGEPGAWSSCLRSYLVSRRGIESKRIVMINGGYRAALSVELWETADRKQMPNPTPHVKPKDVRFGKGKVKHLCEI